MHLLPNHLAPLAALCAKDGARGTSGVQLTLEQPATEGPLTGIPTFTATATDGRRALILTGTCEDTKEYPPIPALDHAQNGASTAIVNARDWKTAFTDCAKRTKGNRYGKPCLKSVACVMGEIQTTLAATDLETVSLHQPRNVEGRFPNVNQVIPPQEKALAAFVVNPHLMAETLEVIAKLATDCEAATVTLELHGDDLRHIKVIGLQASTQTVKARGALVPCVHSEDKDHSISDPRPCQPCQPATEEEQERMDKDELAARAVKQEDEIHRLTKELAAAYTVNADLQGKLDNLDMDTKNLVTLKADYARLEEDFDTQEGALRDAIERAESAEQGQCEREALENGHQIDQDRITAAWKLITLLRTALTDIRDTLAPWSRTYGTLAQVCHEVAVNALVK